MTANVSPDWKKLFNYVRLSLYRFYLVIRAVLIMRQKLESISLREHVTINDNISWQWPLICQQIKHKMSNHYTILSLLKSGKSQCQLQFSTNDHFTKLWPLIFFCYNWYFEGNSICYSARRNCAYPNFASSALYNAGNCEGENHKEIIWLKNWYELTLSYYSGTNKFIVDGQNYKVGPLIQN